MGYGIVGFFLGFVGAVLFIRARVLPGVRARVADAIERNAPRLGIAIACDRMLDELEGVPPEQLSSWIVGKRAELEEVGRDAARDTR